MQEEHVMGKSAVTEKPFYFYVVFWGDRFRRYLIEYCLPSLLSPNNLPVLPDGVNKFIFCTTSNDWEVLGRTQIFSTLQNYIQPHFIEIPMAPPDRSGCEHMGIGHKLATQMAHRDGAYGVFLTPDLMVSDGTVRALRRHAQAGASVVLVSALRFGEEPLFQNLKAAGVLHSPDESSDLRQALVITGRQMVAAGMRSLHSETKRYEWDASYFTNFPSACWWRVPGEEGIVLHSFSWAPMLLDYNTINAHDTTTLDTWTIDGDYVYRNFGNNSNIHVVTDSDEMMLISWSPLEDRPQSLTPNPIKMLPIVGQMIKGGILRASLLSGLFDPLRRCLFFRPVRWHSRALTPVWHATEARAARVLRRYAWDLDASSAHHAHPLWKLFLVPWLLVARIWIVLAHLSQYRSRLAARLFAALRGDREAWARIARRIGLMLRWIRGAEVKNP